jgi:HD-GYP domain-containing protein (c-di-GMP phosphodiesterase class II)
VRYDELTAERPERTSLPNNEALQQIEQLAGTAFDPALTGVFCHTMREQPPQH